MDSRYRKFLALAETGSFSAAARYLHVTQPAISLAVASLEHALGVKLYVRHAKPLVLTSDGLVVVKTARNIAAEVEKMQDTLLISANEESYHIGLIDSIAHLLYTSDNERPLLSGVEVMVDNSRRILRDLLGNKIDLGVITGQPEILDDNLLVRKLHDEEFVFVAAPYHVHASAVTRIDDWLATNADSTTYEHFIELFKHRGLRVKPVFHSASMELLRDMAINGEGTALLPRHIAQAALANGLLQVVKTKPLYRPIWAVTRRLDGRDIATMLESQLNTLLAASR